MGGSKDKIAVALSGGVDSAVAAALLLEVGYDVVGATLRLLSPALGCRGGDTAERGADVARQLGIVHFVIDRVDIFERSVLRPAWREYSSGRTPSPCLLCNERVKFGALLGWALENGCGTLATGHYAKLGMDCGRMRLRRGADRGKDQTYFLSGLNQAQLSRLAFPLGDMEKSQVRAKAAALGLRCAESAESQDVCFVLPGLSFQETLCARFADATAPKTGFVVDWNGSRLVGHRGIHNFTVGQRRGVKVGTGSRAWVRQLDAATGDVHLTNDEQDLLCREFAVSGLRWAAGAPPVEPLDCEVQIRYRSAPVAAKLRDVSDGRGLVTLREPVRAVAPGQAAAFYSGDWVLGRGWIEPL